MTCPPRYRLCQYSGDRIRCEVNIALNSVYGMDLSGMTPQVELNSVPPVEATYILDDMDRGVLVFEFAGTDTASLAAGDYTIGCRMLLPDGEVVTFLALSLYLEDAVVTAI